MSYKMLVVTLFMVHAFLPRFSEFLPPCWSVHFSVPNAWSNALSIRKKGGRGVLLFWKLYWSLLWRKSHHPGT
ncbi:hypothetical protein F5888DRAFT_1269518 [Russula emetica]|nr:hypothetical protein F5888DRAFT_1269518 [Russula emetica]